MKKIKPKSDPITNIITTLGRGLVGIIKLVWRLITGKKSSRKLNQAALFADWQRIEALIENNDMSKSTLAIHQADRFVDHVMKLVGARGETFADRLRSLESKFDKQVYQSLWDAHKIRNQLAHQHGLVLNNQEIKKAISNYRKAARELGAF